MSTGRQTRTLATIRRAQEQNVERSRRLSQLNEKRDRNECPAVLVKLSGTVLRDVRNSQQQCIVAGAESQTDISMDFLHNQESELQRLQQENAELKKQLHEKCFNESTFEGNDEKVLFYTGLPKWSTLFAVFGLVLSYLSQSALCTLSPFQQLVLTLMRLRLGLSG